MLLPFAKVRRTGSSVSDDCILSRGLMCVSAKDFLYCVTEEDIYGSIV